MDLRIVAFPFPLCSHPVSILRFCFHISFVAFLISHLMLFNAGSLC